MRSPKYRQYIVVIGALKRIALNPLPAKLFNLNFHPLEAVSR